MPEWWGGRDLSHSLLKLFLIHFQETIFIAEKDSELAGFLFGFFSQSSPKEAYIHLSAVHPDLRKQGIARALYACFDDVCRKRGRSLIRACTSPINRGSIEFHKKMGFRMEPGEREIDGFPVTVNYLRGNDPKVLFVKSLDEFKREKSNRIRYTLFQFCPSCGGKQIERFQDYGMRCQQCGYLYFHNAASAVSAIIEVHQGIILITRKEAPRRGYLDLPGGFVGHGETLEEALQRETQEELNLAVKGLRYFGSFPNRYTYNGVTYFTTDMVFTCRAGGLRAMRPKEEVSGISILMPGEIDTRKVAFSSVRKALEKYRAVKG